MRSRNVMLSVLLCVAALAAGGLSLAQPRSARAATLYSCNGCGAGTFLWGADFQDPAPWKWGPIRRFDRMLGKKVSLAAFGLPFENCARRRHRCSTYPFPRQLMTSIRRHGAIPVINWSTESIPARLNESSFNLWRIADGRYDRYIRRFARAAKRWGHPFFLRLDWEMNGNWFPWGMGVNGNSPAAFVAAWRHMHSIFTRVGADNAAWVWCPNIGHWASLYKLYPGKHYVDWTCLDGYNWGSTGPGSPGAQRGGFIQFAKLYSGAYHTIVRHLAPEKPMMMGEVASNNHGGSEARWIKRMFSELPGEFSSIQGMLWYQIMDMWDFPIHRHTAAARAFAAGIASERYAPNLFCSVGGSLGSVVSVSGRACR